jgi:hypothetical protein
MRLAECAKWIGRVTDQGWSEPILRRKFAHSATSPVRPAEIENKIALCRALKIDTLRAS